MTAPEKPCPSREPGDDLAMIVLPALLGERGGEGEVRMIHEAEHSERYDYVAAPSDLYVIWDLNANLPAVAASGVLAFPTAEEAATAVDRLNRRRSLGPGASAPAIEKMYRDMIGKGATHDAGEG